MGEENASQLGCQRDETKARDSSSFSIRRDVEGVKGGLTSRHSLLLGLAMSRSLFKIEKKNNNIKKNSASLSTNK